MDLQVIMPTGAWGASDSDSVLDSLMRQIGIKYENDDNWAEKYGTNFKNDKFEMNTFYWGDCECGFHELENEWEFDNRHSDNCYQTKLKTAVAKYDQESGYDDLQEKIRKDNVDPVVENLGNGIMLTRTPANPHLEEWRKAYAKRESFEDKTRKKLCSENKLSYPNGCAVHCTCDYRNNWEKWRSENGHKLTCGIVKPNFKHYSTNFEVRWYKYIGRDMETNIPFTSEIYEQIVKELLQTG